MEPEQSQQSKWRNHPVFRVTTVSKYLALGLMVVLPFLGGWVGYTYAPEKIIESNTVAERPASEEIMSQLDFSSEDQVDRYYKDEYNVILSDVENCADRSSYIYNTTNLEYILQSNPETFIGQYNISGKVGDVVLCKFNHSLQVYESLVDIDIKDEENYPAEIIVIVPKIETSNNNFVYLTSSYHEGLSYNPLLLYDIRIPENAVVNTGFMITSHPDRMVTSDGRFGILFKENDPGTLYAYNFTTGESSKLTSVNTDSYTFFEKDGYGEPNLRIEWIGNHTAIIRAVSLNKQNEMMGEMANFGTELTYDDIRGTDDLIELEFDLSKQF